MGYFFRNRIVADRAASISIDGMRIVGNSAMEFGLSRNVIVVPSVVAIIVPDL
jgi:hypothetical protein